MIELTMPKLGLTMDEGIIAEWHKRPGEPFQDGEPLFAVETDKATLDVEAETNGVLVELLVPVGGKVAVGTPIARIEQRGAAARARAAATPSGAGAPTVNPIAASSQMPAIAASFQTPSIAAPSQTRSIAASFQTSAIAASPQSRSIAEGRLRTSPAVRRRGRELGIDLNAIRGSGPNGRIILRDLPAQPESAGASDAQRAATASSPRGRLVPLSPMRRAIAASMSEAAAVPQFRVTRSVDLTRTLALQEALEPLLKRERIKLSLTDFLLHACALALTAHPEINASYVPGSPESGDHIRLHEHANIGLAVALPGGLMAPVLRDAGRMTLIETSRRRRELTEGARSGRLSAQQMTDATFTLSNLGPMGVDQFDAIVTPPQAAVLAAGRVIQQPVAHAIEGNRVRPTIMLTVTADHRIIDGMLAATFLGAIATVLEQASEYRLFEAARES